MATKETVTSKVLELLNKDLTRSAKEIAETVGTSVSYVYAIKHKSSKAPVKIPKRILNPIEMIEPVKVGF